MLMMVSNRTSTNEASLVLYPTATRTIKIVPATSWRMYTKESLNLIRVANINPKSTRPVSWRYVLGVLPPMVGTPANKLFCSERDSASRSNKPPARARFLQTEHYPRYLSVNFKIINCFKTSYALPFWIVIRSFWLYGSKILKIMIVATTLWGGENNCTLEMNFPQY